MSFMLPSDLVEALILNAFSKDVWHITVKTNFGSVEVDFSDDKFKVLLGSVDEDFAKLLVNNDINRRRWSQTD
jgi:spore coat protein CotH